MKTTILSTAITTLLVLIGTGSVFSQLQPQPARATQTQSRVFINGVGLTSDVVAALEQAAGSRVPSGRYWYDPYCGAWGQEGGPTLGFGIAGIDFGAPMKANASNGHTGTFINGRELPIQDVASLNALIAPSRVLPGKFWLDTQGNVGYVGGPPLGNLVQVAQSKNRGNGPVRSKYAGIGNVIGDGNGAVGFLDPGGRSVTIR